VIRRQVFDRYSTGQDVDGETQVDGSLLIQGP
jgi:hypothetical protein